MARRCDGASSHLYYDKDYTQQHIADLLWSPKHHISQQSVSSIIPLFDEAGCVSPSPRNGRPAGRMSDAHKQKMHEIIKDDPWLYLDEIAARLSHETQTPYSAPQVWRQACDDGYGIKKMRTFAAERDEVKRMLYWDEMSQLVMYHWQCVFVDETSKDGRTLRRANCRALQGERIERPETIIRGKRISVFGVFGYTGFLDWHWVDKGYTAEEFMYAVQEHVVPHLNAYPGPNSILIMDNCPMHYCYLAELVAMVEAKGAVLRFLAPYCPIDNPIEIAFSQFKSCLKRHRTGRTANRGFLWSGMLFVRAPARATLPRSSRAAATRSVRTCARSLPLSLSLPLLVRLCVVFCVVFAVCLLCCLLCFVFFVLRLLSLSFILLLL